VEARHCGQRENETASDFAVEVAFRRPPQIGI